MEMKPAPQDPLVMLHLRNQFYRQKYYLALAVYVLSVMVIITLSTVLVYLVKNPTRPLYFVTDKVGRLIQEIPNSSPNMSQEDMLQWVVDAVELSNSFDYVSYRAQLQDAQKYFTDYGWTSFMNGLKASNNLLALTQRKLIVTAKVVSQPKILNTGVLGGKFAWRYEMPVLVTYLTPPYDDKSKFSNAIVMTVLVQRQSILTSFKGLGIVQMIGRSGAAPASQDMSVQPGS